MLIDFRNSQLVLPHLTVYAAPLDSTADYDADSASFPPPRRSCSTSSSSTRWVCPPHLVRSYLADIVAFLHMRGIVHRDIKDENVVPSAGAG